MTRIRHYDGNLKRCFGRKLLATRLRRVKLIRILASVLVCVCVIHRVNRQTGNVLFAIITGPIDVTSCEFERGNRGAISAAFRGTRKKFRGRNNFFSRARMRATVPGTGSKPTALKIRTGPADIIYAEDITRSYARAEIIPGAGPFAGPGPLEYLVVVKRFRS